MIYLQTYIKYSKKNEWEKSGKTNMKMMMTITIMMLIGIGVKQKNFNYNFFISKGEQKSIKSYTIRLQSHIQFSFFFRQLQVRSIQPILL